MAIDELEYKETNLNELIEIVEKDPIPTNKFTIEDTDKFVLLGKLNEIEQHLRDISGLVSNSDSKANNALEQAIKAVQSATTALDSSNTALDSSNTALATANQAIETANNALQNVIISADVANDAKNIAQNALNIINEANTKANNAVSVADDAKITAYNADAKANSAISASVEANTKADNAISVANDAKVIANLSNTTANEANTTANEAKNIASGANTTANNANTIANEAKITADNALAQVIAGEGTKVYSNNQLLATLNADTKLNIEGGTMTGTLSNAYGIVVGKDNSSANNTKGIVFGENGLTRIGASSSLGLYAERNIYFRPGIETDDKAGLAMTRTAFYPTTDKSMSLGGTSNYFNNIYGTTIYQSGNKVLDVSGGTMDGDIKLPAGKFIVDAGGYGLVGYYGTGNATFGNPNRGINLRGNITRPLYNSNSIAMLSDTTDKAKTDMSNVDAGIMQNGSTILHSCDRVVESFSSTNYLNWYRKWASGWIECGGKFLSNTTMEPIALPVNFTSDATIVLTNRGPSGADKFSADKVWETRLLGVNTSDNNFICITPYTSTSGTALGETWVEYYACGF